MTPPDYAAMSREELEHAARNWEHQFRLVKGTRAREDGPIAGMPWYVRAVVWVGVPVGLIVVFLAQDAGFLPSLARATHANVLATNALVAQHVQKTDAMVERMTFGLRIMCENSAKDQSGRNNCGLIR